VPHRLLTFSLAANVEVCVVCGPQPGLAELQTEVIYTLLPCVVPIEILLLLIEIFQVVRFCKSSVDSLVSLAQCYPRCFPPNAGLDKNLLGSVLVNDALRSLSHWKCCFCCVSDFC
jgi:hypothetical protein